MQGGSEHLAPQQFNSICPTLLTLTQAEPPAGRPTLRARLPYQGLLTHVVARGPHNARDAPSGRVIAASTTAVKVLGSIDQRTKEDLRAQSPAVRRHPAFPSRPRGQLVLPKAKASSNQPSYVARAERKARLTYLKAPL